MMNYDDPGDGAIPGVRKQIPTFPHQYVIIVHIQSS